MKNIYFKSKTHSYSWAYKPVRQEIGRSMVEILGVLAVMGILSVGGVMAYTRAMNQHKANELLNEANKRAVSLAMQVASGRETLSIAEFQNTTSYGTFSTPTHTAGAKTFSLTLTGVEPDVCRLMKTFVGEDSILTIQGECAQNIGLNLIFNTDLYASIAPE